MTPLDTIQTGDRIVATVRTRTGRSQIIRGEVVAVYRRGDGSVSLATVITGQSANRSKRYIDRYNVTAITLA